MSLNVVSNYAADVAQRYLQKSDHEASRSLAKLTAGTRVLNARDDAAAMAVGQRMRAQVASLKQASVNAGQAASMLQIADGTMGTVTDMLVRAKSLATQSASDNVSSAAERAMLDVEYQKLMSEITRVANLTKFNGQSLLNGTAQAATRSASLTGASAVQLIKSGGAAANISATTTTTTAQGSYNVTVSTATAQDYSVVIGTRNAGLNLTDGAGKTLAITTTGAPTAAAGAFKIHFAQIGSSTAFTAQVKTTGGTLIATSEAKDVGTGSKLTGAVAFTSFVAATGQETAWGNFASNFVVTLTGTNAATDVLTNGDSVNIELKGQNNNTTNFTAVLSKVGTAFTATATSAGAPAGNKFSFTGTTNKTALANMGFDLGTDNASNGLEFTFTSAPTNGSVGSFVVTETAARTASTSFQYQLGDSNGVHDSISVAIDSVLLSNLALYNADGTSFSWVGTHSDAAGTTASTGSGLLATGNNLLNRTNASKAIDALERSIDDLSKYRANVGAQQNRMEFAAMNILATVENQEAARSNLMDLDVAAEMSFFTSRQILQQAGVSMLAQANQMPQNLLRLFR
jgi:flagellin